MTTVHVASPALDACPPQTSKRFSRFLATHGSAATWTFRCRISLLMGQMNDQAYTYVVRTVKWDRETATFEQHGSAPSFQGDVLTLCTCKHQMRTSQAAEDRRGVWLAGLTSPTIYDGKHWLFCLAKIETAHESHAELWTSMTPASRRAKAAHVNYLGDLFTPETPLPTADDRFSPIRYFSPHLHSHRWRDEDGWHNDSHNDINYHLADKFGPPRCLSPIPGELSSGTSR